MKRIGELIDEENQPQYPGVDSLAQRVLMPHDAHADGNYFSSDTKIESSIPGLPVESRLMSAYEDGLLNKFLRPVQPIICFEGPMGSGKTTILRRLVSLIRKIPLQVSNGLKVKDTHLLLAIYDFQSSSDDFDLILHPTEADTRQLTDRLVREISSEMATRCRFRIDEKEEFGSFWNKLAHDYHDDYDISVGKVFSRIDGKIALQSISEPEISEEEFQHRKQAYQALKESDHIWFFNYLVILWRYWIHTRCNGSGSKALIILDNLDHLFPVIQRRLLDFIMGASHSEGPVFVLSLRPETRLRLHSSSGTKLLDQIKHGGPEPAEIIMDRLNRFVQKPEDFYDKKGDAKNEGNAQVHAFIKRMVAGMRSDTPFIKFIEKAAGRSIRIAQVIAQGIFYASIKEMGSDDTNEHYLVRCVVKNNISRKEQVPPKSALANLFDTNGVMGDERVLLKPRLLQFLEDKDDGYSSNDLRNVFLALGYEADDLKNGLVSLIRTLSQLVRSDGYDLTLEAWGSDQETLYISRKGKGYVNGLLYDIDYIQEAMLNCRVDEEEWRKMGYSRLSEKFMLLYRFFKTRLLEVDEREVRGFVGRHGAAHYHELFGRVMISVDVIRKTYDAVEKILHKAAERYPYQEKQFAEVQEYFISLLIQADNLNHKLLHFRLEPIRYRRILTEQ